MRFIIFCIFCFLILSSCQINPLHWFNQQRDSFLTHLASQAISFSLTDKEIEDLLYLFIDLREAETCPKMESHISSNSTLHSFEEEYDLSRGFLFKALSDYDYENDLQSLHRNHSETVVFSVVSAWKTEFSLQEINAVLNKVEQCHSFPRNR